MRVSGYIFGAVLLVLTNPAMALTFKSGQTISGGDASAPPITPDLMAACEPANLTPHPTETLQALSFNIRYDSGDTGHNGWATRAPKVASIFAKYDVDFGGLQEVLHHQLDWLEENLPAYHFVGVGRDDGVEAGEYAPIFFRKDMFELIETDTIWLSETPTEAGSKGWDAALPRIATFATLRHKPSGVVMLLGSAHYDHRGTQARQNSGKVIQDYITAQRATYDMPLRVLVGDFNDIPNSSTTNAIERQNCLFDSRRMADNNIGPNSTWNGFRSIEAYRRIDYIFTNPALPVASHIIDDKRIKGGYPSDHLPVITVMSAPQ